MHNHLLAITLIAFLSACTQDPPVYIGSGTYTFISQEDNAPLEGLEDVTVSVDVQAMTFAIEGGDLDVQATLLERAEDDWMESCPTNFSAVQLETMNINIALTIEEETLEAPILFADGCVGDRGETATRLWLSSEAYQASNNSLGDGLYLLEAN